MTRVPGRQSQRPDHPAAMVGEAVPNAASDPSSAPAPRKHRLARPVPLRRGEEETEDLARSVLCPVCAAERGRRCQYNGDLLAFSNYSHTGRLNLARSTR